MYTDDNADAREKVSQLDDTMTKLQSANACYNSPLRRQRTVKQRPAEIINIRTPSTRDKKMGKCQSRNRSLSRTPGKTGTKSPGRHRLRMRKDQVGDGASKSPGDHRPRHSSRDRPKAFQPNLLVQPSTKPKYYVSRRSSISGRNESGGHRSRVMNSLDTYLTDKTEYIEKLRGEDDVPAARSVNGRDSRSVGSCGNSVTSSSSRRTRSRSRIPSTSSLPRAPAGKSRDEVRTIRRLRTYSLGGQERPQENEPPMNRRRRKSLTHSSANAEFDEDNRSTSRSGGIDESSRTESSEAPNHPHRRRRRSMTLSSSNPEQDEEKRSTNRNGGLDQGQNSNLTEPSEATHHVVHRRRRSITQSSSNAEEEKVSISRTPNHDRRKHRRSTRPDHTAPTKRKDEHVRESRPTDRRSTSKEVGGRQRRNTSKMAKNHRSEDTKNKRSHSLDRPRGKKFETETTETRKSVSRRSKSLDKPRRAQMTNEIERTHNHKRGSPRSKSLDKPRGKARSECAKSRTRKSGVRRSASDSTTDKKKKNSNKSLKPSLDGSESIKTSVSTQASKSEKKKTPRKVEEATSEKQQNEVETEGMEASLDFSLSGSSQVTIGMSLSEIFDYNNNEGSLANVRADDQNSSSTDSEEDARSITIRDVSNKELPSPSLRDLRSPSMKSLKSMISVGTQNIEDDRELTWVELPLSDPQQLLLKSTTKCGGVDSLMASGDNFDYLMAQRKKKQNKGKTSRKQSPSTKNHRQPRVEKNPETPVANDRYVVPDETAAIDFGSSPMSEDDTISDVDLNEDGKIFKVPAKPEAKSREDDKTSNAEKLKKLIDQSRFQDEQSKSRFQDEQCSGESTQESPRSRPSHYSFSNSVSD